MITVISMFIGAVITLLAAKYYYQKASKDLETEASELKKLNILMLKAMESAGLVKFNRDENGNIKGMIIDLSSNIETKFETSAIKLKSKPD